MHCLMYGEQNINVPCAGSISFLHTFHPKWWLMPMRGHKRRRLLVLWDNPFITTNWCVIPKWNLHGRLRLIEGRVRVHQIIHDSCSALIRPVCLHIIRIIISTHACAKTKGVEPGATRKVQWADRKYSMCTLHMSDPQSQRVLETRLNKRNQFDFLVFR